MTDTKSVWIRSLHFTKPTDAEVRSTRDENKILLYPCRAATLVNFGYGGSLYEGGVNIISSEPPVINTNSSENLDLFQWNGKTGFVPQSTTINGTPFLFLIFNPIDND